MNNKTFLLFTLTLLGVIFQVAGLFGHSKPPTAAPLGIDPPPLPSTLSKDSIEPLEGKRDSEKGWDFEFGFKDINESGSDQYIVENTNLRKYSEWQNPPITYWGPKGNDIDCSLTQKFTFDRQTDEIQLKVSLASYNFGGGREGKASCWASSDGENWKLVLDNPTPSRIDSYKSFEGELPKESVGSKEIWIQIRIRVSRAPNSSYTLAQFGRSTSNSKGNIFEIKAKLKAAPKPPPVVDQPKKPDIFVNKLVSDNKINLTSGLIAHYPFSGNANDFSGNENHLQTASGSNTGQSTKIAMLDMPGKEAHKETGVTLEAGEYQVVSIPVKQGGKWDAWSAWSGSSKDNFFVSYNLTVDGKKVKVAEGKGNISKLAESPKPYRFTVAKKSEIKLALGDSFPFDNRGGLTLRIDKLAQGPNLVEDRFGMPDSAYAFDGQDDYLFADVKNWTGDYSLSLWAKAAKTAQERYSSVINGFDKTPGSPNTCQIHTSGGLFPTYQFYSSNAESFATVRLEWQHLAVTVNKRLVRFFENGRQVYVQELEGGDANQFSNLIMGRNRHGNRHFEGLIDDVYVYDRALNPAEVTRLHDGGLEDSDGDGLTDNYEVGYGRYELIKGPLDWFKANADAKKRGGHLATITSEAEWHAIREVVGNLPSTYWLGGTDQKTEGNWEWITGELWKFTKWSRNEPNNLGNEDYLQTWSNAPNGNRLWNDNQYNENRNGYILEYGYYTNPTVADSDKDGADDGVEVAHGTDPNNPLSRPAPEHDAPESSPGEAPVVFQKKIQLLENEVAILRDQVKTRDAAITSLDKDLKASKANAEQLKVSLASSNNRVAELEKALREAKTQIVSLEEKLDDKDTRIVYLESEVVQRRHSQQEAQDAADELARIASVPFVNGWCYLPEQGWLWTDASIYPYVYRSDTKSWCYYQQGTLPRLFFDNTSKEWEAWDTYEEDDVEEVASK